MRATSCRRISSARCASTAPPISSRSSSGSRLSGPVLRLPAADRGEPAEDLCAERDAPYGASLSCYAFRRQRACEQLPFGRLGQKRPGEISSDRRNSLANIHFIWYSFVRTFVRLKTRGNTCAGEYGGSAVSPAARAGRSVPAHAPSPAAAPNVRAGGRVPWPVPPVGVPFCARPGGLLKSRYLSEI